MTTKYTKELLEDAVKNSTSMAKVLDYLGLGHTGGNHAYIKRLIESYNISMSQFNGRVWNKGGIGPRKSPSEYLRLYDRNKPIGTDMIRKRMLRDGVKEHRCEVCGNTEWLGDPIPLEIHHIDGDRWNNVLENLQFLCPNCHSKTDNFCGKKLSMRSGTEKKIYRYKKLCACGNKMSVTASRCRVCESASRRMIPELDTQVLAELVNSTSYANAGRVYGVTPTTIRRWLQKT